MIQWGEEDGSYNRAWIMTLTEAAQYLGITRRTVYRLIKADAMPGLTTLGGRQVVLGKVLEAWSEGRT